MHYRATTLLQVICLAGCGAAGGTRGASPEAPAQLGAPAEGRLQDTERSGRTLAFRAQAPEGDDIDLERDPLGADASEFVPLSEIKERSFALIEARAAMVRRSQGTQGRRGIDISTKIVGGERQCEWTAVGAILRNRQVHCSGTLISRHAVLTAAHCLDTEDAKQFTFSLDCKITSDTRPKLVRDVWANKRFPSDRPLRVEDATNDVGILCLSEHPGVAPMAIPSSVLPESTYRRSSLAFVGYGLVDPSDPGSHGVRRRADMKVGEIKEAWFSYGDVEHNTCNIDSGGPAFAGALLVGVTSLGDRSCRTTGVDARVDQNFDFIADRVSACERER
ncbi:S1 family peptidase [Sorangium sp. So ce204]|uniref:S1 family peptidase n=1 Tax=Sorangium sp. So ce204 TaxID=3133288 RepID=UPI003F5F4EB0